ncbi:MAG: LamG-like jellyroll fold domain-containing protein [Cyanobacteria bacterium P01_F01_bin.143]
MLDNPIAYWSLNGVTDNLGTLGSLVDGVYSGNPTTISGLISDGDSAMDFDGVDDGILIPNNSSINTGESYSQKTIELTFNTDRVSGKQILYEQGGTWTGINIYLQDNQLNLGAWVSDAGEWLSYDIDANTTYNVVLVFDSGELKGYVNGESIGTVATSFTSIPSHSGDIAIGQINNDTRFSNTESSTDNNGYYFDGTIDDVALYNTALSKKRVEAHYNAIPIVGNIYNNSLEGDTEDNTIIGDGNNNILSLDGNDDYIKTNNLTGLNTGNTVHTIEQWVYISELPSERSWLSVLGQYGTGSHHWLLHADGQLQIGVYNRSGQQLLPSLAVGEWTHVATVYDGSNLTLYINGEEFGSTAASFNFTNTEYSIGRPLNWQPNFKGQVDEVRVWNTARTEQEIQDNYKSSLTGTENGLVGYWNFDRDSANDNNIADLTSNGNDASLVNGQQNNIVIHEDNSDHDLSLDGNNDYVKISNVTGLNTGDTVHTIEQWVYLPELPSGRAWLSVLGQYGRGSHHWLVHSDGHMQVGFYGTSNGQLLPTLEAGKWTHLATVYDGTTLTLYINGEEFGSTPASFNFTNTDFHLGRPLRSDPNFKGKVDEVRIWNTARTEQEIQDHYQTSLKGTESGLVGYWNFDGDLSSNNIITDLTGNGNDGTLFNGQGNHIVLNSQELGDDTLEGKLGNDYLDGRTGDDVLVGDNRNNLLRLDGIDDYVQVGNESNFDSITNTITVETWIKVESFTKKWQTIVSKGNDSWRLSRNANSNYLHFAIGNSSASGNINVNDGEWHHVVGVYDGTSIKLYVDGVLDQATTVQVSIPTNDHNVTIGANEAAAGREFHGKIDEVRIWNTARTQQEIKDNDRATLTGNENGLVGYWNFENDWADDDNITDLTNNGNDGTLVNGQGDHIAINSNNIIHSEGSIVLDNQDSSDNVLRLDGTNDYVITNSLTGINTGNSVHTIEQWVYLPELPSGRAWLSVLGQYETGSHPWLINSNGQMQIGVYGRSHQQFQPTIKAGKWTHLATVYDGAILTLYINGEEYGSLLADFNFANTDFKLGFPLYSENNFKGQVDEVRIWNTARSQQEIQDNYQSSLTGAESGLVAYWNFDSDSSSSNTITDLTSNGNNGTFVNGQGNHILTDFLGGNDTLVGGEGNDTLTGNDLADTFVFNSVTEGIDTITDFNQTQGDKILLPPDFGATSLDQFSFDSASGAVSFEGTQFAILEDVTSINLTSAFIIQQSFTIAESAAIASVIGSVAINNPATTNAYQIISGDEQGIFAIDASTGEITVAGELNYEDDAIANSKLEIQVTDDSNQTYTKEVYITTTDVSEDPNFSSQGFVLSESLSDEAVISTIIASDDESGTNITYEILSGNESGIFSLDQTTGEITLVDSSQIEFVVGGSYELLVRVTDLDGQSTEEIVSIFLDKNPVAENDNFSTTESVSVSGNVLNDNGNGVDSDPEELALSVISVDGVAAREDTDTGEPITLNSGALLTINSDGSFDYDPNGQFEYLAEGETTTDSFSYQLSDPVGGVETGIATISFTGQNDNPVAQDDAIDTVPKQSQTGNVLDSNGHGADIDADTSDLVVVSAVNGDSTLVGQQITLASGALLTLHSDGDYEYDPNGQFDHLIDTRNTSSDSFTYTIVDPLGLTSSATATVTIMGERTIYLENIPSADNTQGFVINGEQTEAHTGYSVSTAGDVNNDGYGDFIVSAPKADGGVVPEGIETDFSMSAGVVLQDSFLAVDYIANSVINPNDPEFYLTKINNTVVDKNNSSVNLTYGTLDVSFISSPSFTDGSFTYTPNANISLAAGETVTETLYVDAYETFNDPNGSYSDGFIRREYHFDIPVKITLIGGGDVGSTYVVFGQDDGSVIDLGQVSNGEGGFVISGEANSGEAGFAVSGGKDINGDDLPDLLIGTPFSNVGDGSAYAVFNPSDGNFTDVYLGDITSDSNDGGFILDNGGNNSNTGYGVALADVNGNGLADVVVSSPDEADDGYGNVWVAFDQAQGTAIDLSSLQTDGNGFIIKGRHGWSQGHYLSSAGDFNGDGYEDILIGQKLGDNYIVFGKEDTTEVKINFANINAVSSDFFVIDAPKQSEVNFESTSGLASSGGGDVNGDGLADVVVAESDWNNNTTEINVLFGQSDSNSVSLDSIDEENGAGFTIEKHGALLFRQTWSETDGITFSQGNDEVQKIPTSIIGDINGDGLDDIVINFSSKPAINDNIYVIFGKTDSLLIDLDQPLSPDVGFVIEGTVDRIDDEHKKTFFQAKGAGDVNGDGLADLIIGAPYNNENDSANDNTGKAYILFGSDFTKTITHQGDETDNTLTGTSSGESFVAGLGNDTIIGGGGADVLYGGAGNDLIAIADATFQRVDGGLGDDTLALSGSDTTLDLEALRGLIRSIENIDLTGTGNNTLNITSRDLVNLSDTSNRLIVTGDVGDSVYSIGQDWLLSDVVTIDGNSFNLYNTGNAELLIDTEITAYISPSIPDQYFSIDENSANGTIVGTISSLDSGGSAIAEYNILSGDDNNGFAIDNQSGDILVNNAAVFDFETTSSFSLEVQIDDSQGLQDTAIITVDLNDINDTPVFAESSYDFAIAEHSDVGTILGSVSASDQDAGESLTYSFSAGNDSGIFAVDAQTGEVTIANGALLDYETQISHNLTVRVTDLSGAYYESQVSVDVTDKTNIVYNTSLAFDIEERDGNDSVLSEIEWINGIINDKLDTLSDSFNSVPSSLGSNESFDLNEYELTSDFDLQNGGLSANLPIDVRVELPDGIAPGQSILVRSGAKLQNTATMVGFSPSLDVELGLDIDVNLNTSVDLPPVLTSKIPSLPSSVELLDEDNLAVEGLFEFEASEIYNDNPNVDTSANALSVHLQDSDWVNFDASGGVTLPEFNIWERVMEALGVPTEVTITDDSGNSSVTIDFLQMINGDGSGLTQGTWGNNDTSVSWSQKNGWSFIHYFDENENPYIDRLTWNGDQFAGQFVIHYDRNNLNSLLGADVYGTIKQPKTTLNYDLFDTNIDPRVGLNQNLSLGLDSLQGTLIFTEMAVDDPERTIYFDTDFVSGNLESSNLTTTLITVPLGADANGDGVVEIATEVKPDVNVTDYTEVDFNVDYDITAGSLDYRTTIKFDAETYEIMTDNSRYGDIWDSFRYAARPWQLVGAYESRYNYEWNYYGTYSKSSVNALDLDSYANVSTPLVTSYNPNVDTAEAFTGGTQVGNLISHLIQEDQDTYTASFNTTLNGYSFTLDSSPDLGSVINNNDGTFTFTLANDFTFLGTGDYEDTFFNYTATDGLDIQTGTIALIMEGDDGEFISYESSNSADFYLWDGLLDLTQETYVLTHGWRSNGVTDKDWIDLAKSIKDYSPHANIIFTDWTELAGNLNYWESADDTETVGQELATFLDEQGVDAATTTLIGHSLGSHVSGVAGDTYDDLTGNSSFSAIVGLDPAGPDFEDGARGLSKRLDPSDADRVVTFHSSPTLGYDGQLGDVDLYLNWSDSLDIVSHQPGESSFFGNHGYPIELLSSLYQGSAYSQTDNGAIFNYNEVLNLASGSYDISTVAQV